jgi:Putative transposase/Transposase zinc-binding domain
MNTPPLELADIVRCHGADFLAEYGGSLTDAQKKALRDVAACRTAVLGGHLWQCLDCGQAHAVYHSCRNRHCPKCQAQSRARWLAQQQETLLPVEYFHVVFTLPEEVAAVALANPVTVYNLLFQAARETLLEVAADPKHLGALPGVLMVLHTWGQNLHHHPHVHCVATGGGLSCNTRGEVDETPRWVSCRPGFFLPVRVLSRKYRGKFLELLRQSYARGELRWHAWADAATLAAWLTPLYQKEWVVYAKEPFGGPEQVLKYLARYTHRVAISNRRLLELCDGEVTFGYKDYRRPERPRQMTLSAVEFLRRWAQHVLPRGFVKVRHYGLWSNRQRVQRLALCRRLLVEARVSSRLGAGAEEERIAEPRCPHCGGVRVARLAELPRATRRRECVATGDTS